ncbi:transposase [Streptomyces sp. NBC_00289]|uniref:transposase n=1 Tax=Streptomyces sp. NBC_00289 TaxID=2975703 RepID=UPI0032476748
MPPTSWLSTPPLAWRKSIRCVAFDMSATYRAAIRTGLPGAVSVVDHFHVVQRANKVLSTVRRRTTAGVRGRRGRATDPEWTARRRLLRNRENLTDEQFAKMWNPLLNEGPIGQRLLTVWIARESLRTLLALARTGADREQAGHARWKFLTWCADSGIPALAITVDRWWPEIAAFIDNRTRAKSEGINRVIKLVARNALRLSQRRQSTPTHTRCVTTRRARGHLRTA